MRDPHVIRPPNQQVTANGGVFVWTGCIRGRDPSETSGAFYNIKRIRAGFWLPVWGVGWGMAAAVLKFYSAPFWASERQPRFHPECRQPLSEPPSLPRSAPGDPGQARPNETCNPLLSEVRRSRLCSLPHRLHQVFLAPGCRRFASSQKQQARKNAKLKFTFDVLVLEACD